MSETESLLKALRRTIPADTRRHPPGCPDPDWCCGNRRCWWDCRGLDAEEH